MPHPCRLLVDPPGDGCWNMAVDEVLLDGCDDDRPILRFYEWSPATLSLGYFQPIVARQQHQPSLGCPLVRRASGGGAILHDQELTYSLVLPQSLDIGIKRESMVDCVHAALIEALAEFAITDCHAAGSLGTVPTQDAPFFCFQRTAEPDVLLCGRKICGSAQRRNKTAYLQHGSVLLRRSTAAPELPGICDLVSVNVTCRSLRDAWSRRLAAKLGLDFKPDTLRPNEQTAAQRLCDEKYGAPHWNEQR